MIEKMKFLSITGPKGDIDRVVEKYLSKYPIHLENALSELASVKDLYPYLEVNPYKDWLTKANSYVKKMDRSRVQPGRELAIEEAIDVIRETEAEVMRKKKKIDKMKEEQKEKRELLRQIAPFRMIPFDITKLLNFRYIRYRFGRIPRESYQKFERYVYDNSDVIFLKCQTAEDYVWGIYFVPQTEHEAVDAVLSSLHFERIILPDSYEGTAQEAYDKLSRKIKSLKKKIKKQNEEVTEILTERGSMILSAQKKLKSQSVNFDARKLAAVTKEKSNTFYILCGWMSEKDAEDFQKEIAEDEKIYCIVETPETSETYSKPPTKLKNPKLFRPFEMYIRMYGLPAYNEIDPTAFVALTYAFIFGAMFGDLGQGLLLAVGGALLYKRKHMPLAAIISLAGVFSAFFGVMFGSVFGFEDLIPAFWLRPKEAMTNLPLIGNLNTVFVVAIAFGMFLVLVTMVFHIINAIKAHRPGDQWFDTNGVAGFVFYASLTVILILFMSGHAVPPAGVIGVLLGAPLLVIALKEPLTNLMLGHRPLIETGIVMFVVQTFFEMFETMLSFFSNTLSFVRVGAFAVSHAAMMEVVLMLAGAENGGSINWVVVVLGNLFVCGLEGLIVGIQVLRLEYYEMFSRFYKGDGREFKPFIKKKKK